MSPSKTVLVTGCAGFIGSNFMRIFRNEFPKTRIVGIDNFSTGRRELLSKDIIFNEGSITDAALIEKIFKKHKPEYVFHFAAVPRVSYSVEFPVETTAVNIGGTVALLDASARHGVKRFIYSSSSSLYGGAKKLPTKESENAANPKSPYAAQKYAGELMCKIFSDLYALDTVSLRYFNAFGPYQYGDSPYSTVVSAWLESMYFPKKKKAFLEGTGNKTRDFCYVDNIVRANILAMTAKKPLKGVALNIAHGERTSMQDVKRLLETYSGKKLVFEKRPDRIGDVAHTHADITFAKKILGYTPEVRFEEGIKRTIEWFNVR